MADDDVKAKVLEANLAFYRAFTQGDIAAMRELWAERAEVLCFHPGGALLRGRVDVLGAWSQILAAPPPIEMRCHDASAQVLGDVAIVTCYEGNGAQAPHLAATNVFVLEEGRWRMLHHHAGPLATRVPVRRGSGDLN
ncbi:MAG TPA: nuclear transport factor 2 family protein [Polyangiales bacterium]|jgi:ketosteroid isomerase-like protein|nr:nuclear transport factor 2 family protein [Polyangiales bacterium]